MVLPNSAAEIKIRTMQNVAIAMVAIKLKGKEDRGMKCTTWIKKHNSGAVNVTCVCTCGRKRNSVSLLRLI